MASARPFGDDHIRLSQTRNVSSDRNVNLRPAVFIERVLYAETADARRLQYERTGSSATYFETPIPVIGAERPDLEIRKSGLFDQPRRL